jgi:hypothetical protein
MAQRVGPNWNGPTEPAAVRTWRRNQFLALGFTPREAELMAKSSVDLGEVRKLLAAGCPPETARRIVL